MGSTPTSGTNLGSTIGKCSSLLNCGFSVRTAVEVPHRNRNARFQTSLTDARGRHSELKPHFLRVRGPGQVPAGLCFSGTTVLRLPCKQDCQGSTPWGSSNRGYRPFLLVKNKRMGLMGQKSQWGDTSFANLRWRVRSPYGPPARNCVKRVSGRISN